MFFTRLLRKSGRKSARQNRQEFGLNQRIKSIYIRRIYFAELLLPAQTKNLNPIYKQSETRPHRSGAALPRERNSQNAPPF